MSDTTEPKLIAVDDIKLAFAAADHVELLGWKQRADAIRRLAVVAELLAEKALRVTTPRPPTEFESRLAQDPAAPV